MRHFRLMLASLILASASTSLLADGPIPYNNIGTIAPTFLITASTTGDVLGYFAGSSAGYTDFIRLFDKTSNSYSDWVLNNHTSTMGELFDFGSVNQNDVLVFQMLNGADQILSSDPASSMDGVNHAYVTTFSGGTIPGGDSTIFGPGLYVGMEDLPQGGGSDFDYNDDSFIFENVAATKVDPDPPTPSPVPEPSTLVMFGTGILAAAGAMRRRISTR
jgi:PEP-CTERM motif